VASLGQQGPIRVFIVSDVRLYREGLSDLLGRVERLTVVGAARSAGEAAERLSELRPDVVLVDTGAPSNVDAAHGVAQAAPDSQVVAVAAPESEEEVISLAEAGVLGYVTRDQSLDDLVTAIESASRNEMVCSPWIASLLVKRVRTLAAEHRRDPTPRRLTAREHQILELVAHGLSNKEIAARLHIEVATVKNHVHNILEKLEVSRRSEAVALMGMRFAPGRTPPPPGAAA
jgi:DNA-binding NarL/FixJ family response regulator